MSASIADECVRTCIYEYVHWAFDAINSPVVVDMQSLEVFLHSQLFLCKHQNVIKTNRSGFLISFSFLCCARLLFVSQCEMRKKLHRGWVFIFIMNDLVHNARIYAFKRLLAQIFHFHKAEVETERRKRIENESLWLFVRLLTDCISFMMALVYSPPFKSLNEKLKVYFCRAFVCTEVWNKGDFSIRV